MENVRKSAIKRQECKVTVSSIVGLVTTVTIYTPHFLPLILPFLLPPDVLLPLGFAFLVFSFLNCFTPLSALVFLYILPTGSSSVFFFGFLIVESPLYTGFDFSSIRIVQN